MSDERWEVGPVLSRSWTLFTENLGVVLGATIVMALINGLFSGLGGQLDGVLAGSDSALVHWAVGGTRAAVGLLGWTVSVFLTLGMLRLYLGVARGQAVSIADLFSGGRYLVPGFLAWLISGLGVMLGLALFVVPGMVLALGWMFAQLLIVDRDLGPIEALKESWRLTRGEKGGLLLWLLVCAGISVLGLMACGLGLFVAMPVCGLGTTLIYLDLDRRDGEVAA